ncbi:hypothetical protein Dimus_034112 [Dionaea muscipula]
MLEGSSSLSSSPRRIRFPSLSSSLLYAFDDPLGFQGDHEDDLLLENNNTMINSSSSSSHKIGGGKNSNQGIISHSSPPLSSSSSSANSNNGFLIHAYGGDFMRGGGSLLSFQHDHDPYDHIRSNIDFPLWENSNVLGSRSIAQHQSQQQLKLGNNPRANLDDVNYNCSLQITSSGNHDQLQDLPNGWLFGESSTLVVDSAQDQSRTQQACLNKRPRSEESVKGMKKQRSSSSRKAKPMLTTTSTKDPQSIAAKNRRERISERLKILQDLVPNGSKVDLVTMLEKAISYVKFLQLQVTVLATDEFWPAAGGKPPDVSQVREAMDAILSSQRQGQAPPTTIRGHRLRRRPSPTELLSRHSPAATSPALSLPQHLR